ncbi:GNAT family N-acetyltransferase [Paraoerskovia marina]|uniref:GNAT family N-acetyltransferase n=1 Tax=Paraoerskovia marina TaxID=545619 RepID=UPI000492D916|nr:GNAT family N-acetyltransferase [Paraoerskovia marina]
MSDTEPRYPIEWEADVVLRDGSTAHLRPIEPTDADALQRFHMAQSEQSTYLRFFAPMERLSARDLERFTTVDHHDRVALVVVRRVVDGEEIVGVGRFDRVARDEAEVAFNIADAAQGRGVGSVLLEHLATAAREVGVRRFTADVLPQNGRMIAVFREAGYAVTQHLDDGVVQVSVDLDPTERSREVMADREHRAEARSMQAVLGARSVLVVGPPGSCLQAHAAERVAASLRAAETRHRVVTVTNAFDLDVLDEPVELAVVSLAPEIAVDVVPHLENLGVRALVLLSGGYAESGAEGLSLQRDLLRAAHGAGMRVVGPASYGLFVRREDGDLNASLSDELPPAGRVGFFCQSSPMAVTLLATVARRRLGVSSFLSAGNRAGVSGNDLMQYWQDDENTDVVCLYLESIGNPRKFSRIARRLSRVKPVVVVTAGRSGHVVPAGHAVRTTRAPRRTLDEMLRQSGVIRADNTHHLVDIAQLLEHQPLPTGRRVGILASSPALAALVAEAVSSAGLEVAEVSRSLAEDADDETVTAAVDAVYAEGTCDAVVVVHVPTLRPRTGRVASAVARAAARTGRTSVVSMLGLHGLDPELTATSAGVERIVPAYSTPEDAVAALGAVVRYVRWRAQDQGVSVSPPGLRPAAARAVVESALAGPEPVALDERGTHAVLDAYGIDLWETVNVSTVDEAVRAADELGYPVALKHTAESLRHRSDLGAVRLDIQDADELREDFAAMLGAFTDVVPAVAPAPFEIQRMAGKGVACVIRSAEDQLFGPVVSFGLAGDAVDLLADVASGVPPLTDVDVATIVRSVRAAPRLFGYRGAPVSDVAALEDLVARVSVMADDLPELRSLELYPVVVAERGATVLSARLTVAPAHRADTLRRALPA